MNLFNNWSVRKGLIACIAVLATVVVAKYLHLQYVAVDERQAYSEYINNHPYATREIGREEYEQMPKKDRPDLAAEHNFLMTVDPALKRVPTERLVPAYDYTKRMLAKKQSSQGTRIDSQGFKERMSKNGRPLAAIPGVSWTERGPDNIGGRTRALMWDPNDGNVRKVWAGSVSGGLWFNNNITDETSSWFRIDDFLASLAISSLAFDPNNTMTFYAATGEGYIAGNDGGGVPGVGVYKSTNGGGDWELLSSTDEPSFRYIQKLVVTPTGAVLISTLSSINEGGISGIYRSTDGGNNWTRVLTGRGADIEVAANGDIYASTGFLSSIGTGRVHRSTNDGQTWTEITPPSATAPSRIELAVAPSQSSVTGSTVVYAVAQNPNPVSRDRDVAWFQRSDDGGTTWTNLSIPQYREQGCFTAGTHFTRGQAFYDLILAVKPDDATVVTLGGINVLRSSNSGVDMDEVSYWTGQCDAFVHADLHEIVFRPGFPSQAILGHDGGVSYSTNLGSSANPSFVTSNNNYSVTQFYSVAAENAVGSGYFLAGSQDNGTQRFTAATGTSTQEATGGDGGFTHIDQTDASFQITAFTRNTVNHSSDGGNSFRRIADSDVGLFINPSDLDNDAHILYSAGDEGQLLRIANINTISPGTQQTITLDLGQITHIQANAFTDNRIFVGTRDAEVFLIDNANGANPVAVNITSNISTSVGTISSIDVGATDEELLVTISNFGVTSVWVTQDGGLTWLSRDELDDGLPDIPVRWGMFNPTNTRQVLLATELGVWSTSNIFGSTPNWEPTVDNLANVRCDMLQYREVDGVVIVATFGRGLFSTDVFSAAADNTAPELISIDPFTGDTDVFTNTNLFADFSEPIKAGTGSVQIRRASDDVLFETINVINAEISATTFTVNPVSDLDPNTEYYVTIDAGAILDNVDNPYAGLADNSIWTFTTFDGDFPPTLSNPLEDVWLQINKDDIEIFDLNLTDVFTDIDNDNSSITKAVVANSNPTLVSTSIVADNTLRLSIMQAIFGTSSITVQATSNGKTVESSFSLTVGDPILFDQLNNEMETGILSSQIVFSNNSIVQSADDFGIDFGENWQISGITINGQDNLSDVENFNVEIYRDLNGAPDDNELVYQTDMAITFEPGQREVRLPIDVELEAGKYWLSVYNIAETADQLWEWTQRTPITDNVFRIVDRKGVVFGGAAADQWISGNNIQGEANTDFVYRLEGQVIPGESAATELAATQTGNTSPVRLQWIDNATTETGYRVERSLSKEGEFTVIETVEADETTFEDTSVESNTTYFYIVQALATINSAYSDTLEVLTLPATPTLEASSEIGTESFTINWQTTDGATSFEVDVSIDDFTTFVTGFEGNEVNDATSLEVTGLDKNVYQFRVRAANASGLSDNSSTGMTETITGLLGDFSNTFDIKLYPNPAGSELMIILPQAINQSLQLSIYDVNGKKMVSERSVDAIDNRLSIDLDRLNVGYYLIRLKNEDHFSTARFMKIN
ncbi:T9SS type A sorting domain-containing protein [Fulvivirga sp. M361]|uniref:Ig-like domain-containing protein n=1 Tax=Fulvivirga sp. M361 TaxID=2594266 RepID=UPI001179B061|nr:Ig-like domain-containing protein [Fulvivirga sp. M361]TRX51765.1 T9SS type A sorting domain-containing protein [Fulvivirga sp. M361]